jgi:hypothetical protein
MVIGKQELDSAKAVLGGGSEAFQEGVFLVHHRKVGGEFGHGTLAILAVGPR